MNKSREKFIKGATGERGEQEFLNDQQVLSWLRFGETIFWVRLSVTILDKTAKTYK